MLKASDIEPEQGFQLNFKATGSLDWESNDYESGDGDSDGEDSDGDEDDDQQ